MLGEWGFSELIVMLVMVVLLFIVPASILAWVLYGFVIRRRERNEPSERVEALETKQSARDR